MKGYTKLAFTVLISASLVACGTHSKTSHSSTYSESKNVSQSDSYYFIADSDGILKVDSLKNRVVDTISLESPVYDVKISPDGTHLGAIYTINNRENCGCELGNGTAIFYDISTGEMDFKLQVGKRPAHIGFTPDEEYVLVTNSIDNTVSVIDWGLRMVEHTIPVGKNPQGFSISPDSQFAYVANMGENTVSVIDLKQMKEVRKINVGEAPVTTEVTKDGKTIVVALDKENALAVVDLTNNHVQKIPVGSHPAQVAISPDSHYALVSNQGTEDQSSSTVSKIDLSTKKIVSTIQVGKGAYGIAMNEKGTFAYVTNMYDDTVSVIDNAKNQVVKTVKVEDTPKGIVFYKEK
jgi:YVTN family beta-propeller protein